MSNVIKACGPHECAQCTTYRAEIERLRRQTDEYWIDQAVDRASNYSRLLKSWLELARKHQRMRAALREIAHAPPGADVSAIVYLAKEALGDE